MFKQINANRIIIFLICSLLIVYCSFWLYQPSEHSNENYENRLETALSLNQHLNDSLDELAEFIPDSIPSDTIKTNIYYSVQIGYYRNVPAFQKLRPVFPLDSEVTRSGMIRYTVGMFTQSEEAEMLREEILELGVKDAFVFKKIIN